MGAILKTISEKQNQQDAITLAEICIDIIKDKKLSRTSNHLFNGETQKTVYLRDDSLTIAEKKFGVLLVKMSEPISDKKTNRTSITTTPKQTKSTLCEKHFNNIIKNVSDPDKIRDTFFTYTLSAKQATEILEKYTKMKISMTSEAVRHNLDLFLKERTRDDSPNDISTIGTITTSVKERLSPANLQEVKDEIHALQLTALYELQCKINKFSQLIKTANQESTNTQNNTQTKYRELIIIRGTLLTKLHDPTSFHDYLINDDNKKTYDILTGIAASNIPLVAMTCKITHAVKHTLGDTLSGVIVEKAEELKTLLTTNYRNAINIEVKTLYNNLLVNEDYYADFLTNLNKIRDNLLPGYDTSLNEAIVQTLNQFDKPLTFNENNLNDECSKIAKQRNRHVGLNAIYNLAKTELSTTSSRENSNTTKLSATNSKLNVL